MPQKLGHKTSIFHPKILGHHPIATPAKYNPTTIPPTKALLLTNLSFINANIENNFKIGKFDVVIMSNVLEHMKNRKNICV